MIENIDPTTWRRRVLEPAAVAACCFAVTVLALRTPGAVAGEDGSPENSAYGPAPAAFLAAEHLRSEKGHAPGKTAGGDTSAEVAVSTSRALERLLAAEPAADVGGSQPDAGAIRFPAPSPEAGVDSGSGPGRSSEEKSARQDPVPRDPLPEGSLADDPLPEDSPRWSAELLGRATAEDGGREWVFRTEPYGRLVRVGTEPEPDRPDSAPRTEAEVRLLRTGGALELVTTEERYRVREAPWQWEER
ncbi:MAG: hypothetical protein ACLFM5_08910 [Spirochaetaceae bacterium]